MAHELAGLSVPVALCIGPPGARGDENGVDDLVREVFHPESGFTAVEYPRRRPNSGCGERVDLRPDMNLRGVWRVRWPVRGGDDLDNPFGRPLGTPGSTKRSSRRLHRPRAIGPTPTTNVGRANRNRRETIGPTSSTGRPVSASTRVLTLPPRRPTSGRFADVAMTSNAPSRPPTWSTITCATSSPCKTV